MALISNLGHVGTTHHNYYLRRANEHLRACWRSLANNQGTGYNTVNLSRQGPAILSFLLGLELGAPRKE